MTGGRICFVTKVSPQGPLGSIEVKENITIDMVVGITKIMGVDTREEAMNYTKSTNILRETQITFFTMCTGKKVRGDTIECRMFDTGQILVLL